MASQLQTLLTQFRAQLLARDARALQTVMAQYDAMRVRLQPAIAALLDDMLTNGVTTSTDLFQLDRWVSIERQLTDEIDRIAHQMGTRLIAEQTQIVLEAGTKAQQLAQASAGRTPLTSQITGGWTKLPVNQLTDLIGSTQSNAPLGQLLDAMPGDATAAIRAELLEASAEGVNPRVVANRITKAVDISQNRALTISRTEMLRVDRAASLRQYEANDQFLKGWYWSCAKQSRTCAACIALDGRLFDLTDTFMRSHVNCRCQPRPALKRKTAQPETGSQWLAKQPKDVQDSILGKTGGQAYRDGEVTPDDFVRLHTSETWGESYTNGGVAHAKAKAINRKESE